MTTAGRERPALTAHCALCTRRPGLAAPVRHCPGIPVVVLPWEAAEQCLHRGQWQQGQRAAGAAVAPAATVFDFAQISHSATPAAQRSTEILSYSASMAAVADAAFDKNNDDQAYEVLQAIIADGTCDVHVLASICNSSKQMRANCLKLLREQPLKQVAVLLAGLHAAAKLLQEQVAKQDSSVSEDLEDNIAIAGHVQPIWWFQDTALPPDTAQLLPHPGLICALLLSPNFPLQLAAGLCQRGLCVPYNDIAAAACGINRVESVEVWVLAQPGHLGVAASIPAAAQQLLCQSIAPAGGTPVSIDVPTLIKLGFNSSNAATVAAAASMLQQLPGLAVAEIAELLYTAVVRHEANHALDFLQEAITYRWRPVQLSAEELLPVLQQAVSLGVQTSESAESMFRSLASLHRVLPAGRVPAGAVASLFQMALEVGSHSRCFDWLESFPAFSHISAQQLMDLLKAVLLASESNYSALHALSHIQAFSHLDAAAATGLFTSTFTKEAAAAQAEHKWPNLSLLCKSILHPNVAAARDSEEIMRWLLPALAELYKQA
uniref:Uncharacterized protein n=1 Tax=Tetradesmus obliquus TaxID=3088 RepID=A0A383VIC9_TETOB|eukprot:jgi/Sobl393_1/5498/SZX64424.1